MCKIEVGFILSLDGIVSLMASDWIEEDAGRVGKGEMLAVAGEEEVADEEGEEGQVTRG